MVYKEAYADIRCLRSQVIFQVQLMGVEFRTGGKNSTAGHCKERRSEIESRLLQTRQ